MFFQANPENRSVMSICVVEEATKSPLGYQAILKTKDLDADADLWRDGFFGRRVTRYVCISKSQGKPEHIITDLRILQDKEMPPEDYSLISNTIDSNQKAFKKKQLCYKLAHFKSNVESIADVIILSKIKSGPVDGYDNIGELNGMHFCIRKISAITRMTAQQGANPYGLYRPLDNTGGGMYPNIQNSLNDLTINSSNGFGGNISNPNNGYSHSGSAPNSPFYPNFPNQPLMPTKSDASTISSISAVDGIPFILRSNLKSGNAVRTGVRAKNNFLIKTQMDLEQEYSYDFITEKQALEN